MARTTGRLTATLPLSVIRDLDTLCGYLSISRSALLSMLLSQPLAEMIHIVGAVKPLYPGEPLDRRSLRARGESERVIQSLLGDMRREFDSLEGGEG